jgi:hypothetical protein
LERGSTFPCLVSLGALAQAVWSKAFLCEGSQIQLTMGLLRDSRMKYYFPQAEFMLGYPVPILSFFI